MLLHRFIGMISEPQKGKRGLKRTAYGLTDVRRPKQCWSSAPKTALKQRAPTVLAGNVAGVAAGKLDGLKHYITKRLKEIAARYDGAKSFDY